MASGALDPLDPIAPRTGHCQPGNPGAPPPARCPAARGGKRARQPTARRRLPGPSGDARRRDPAGVPASAALSRDADRGCVAEPRPVNMPAIAGHERERSSAAATAMALQLRGRHRAIGLARQHPEQQLAPNGSSPTTHCAKCVARVVSSSTAQVGKRSPIQSAERGIVAVRRPATARTRPRTGARRRTLNDCKRRSDSAAWSAPTTQHLDGDSRWPHPGQQGHGPGRSTGGAATRYRRSAPSAPWGGVKNSSADSSSTKRRIIPSRSCGRGWCLRPACRPCSSHCNKAVSSMGDEHRWGAGGEDRPPQAGPPAWSDSTNPLSSRLYAPARLQPHPAASRRRPGRVAGGAAPPPGQNPAARTPAPDPGQRGRLDPSWPPGMGAAPPRTSR